MEADGTDSEGDEQLTVPIAAAAAAVGAAAAAPLKKKRRKGIFDFFQQGGLPSKPPRPIDRSGAAPSSGVNKGLTIEQRLESPEKSVRARGRKLATNNPK